MALKPRTGSSKSLNLNKTPNQNLNKEPSDPSITENSPKNLLSSSKPSLLRSLSKSSPSIPIPDFTQLVRTNQEVFKNLSFRPFQREIIESVLQQKDTFVCMPTGGGKSLTFQLPAILSQGITIVIMPLLSLIYDQGKKLESFNIPYEIISGTQKKVADSNIYNKIKTDLSIKILFVTPEKLAKSQKIMDLFDSLHLADRLSRFVIDEAHCVSKWGRDFRGDYLKLSNLKKTFPKIPILALTGTATDQIREDVVSVLSMRAPKYFLASFNRPNLFYSVYEKTNKCLENIATYIKNKQNQECGLIYCISKKDCEKVSKKLSFDYKITSHHYHADLNDKDRHKIQDQWMEGKIQVIVATIAFGMGIDKKNVRFVIHYSFPRSIENYYQESGRAGRDGLRSDCIIYFNNSDKYKHDKLLNTQKRQSFNLTEIYQIMKYCENIYTCRRKIVLEYFGEKFDDKNCNEMCDSCLFKRKGQSRNFRQEALKILNFVQDLPKSVKTLLQISSFLRGVRVKTSWSKQFHEEFGVLHEMKQEDLECVIRHMIYENVLCEKVVKNFKKFKITKIDVGENSERFKNSDMPIIVMIQKCKNPVRIPLQMISPRDSENFNDKPEVNILKSNRIILPASPEDQVDIKKNIESPCVYENSKEKPRYPGMFLITPSCQKNIRKEVTEKKVNFCDMKNEEFGKCQSQDRFEDLKCRLELIRKKIAKTEHKEIHEVLGDEELVIACKNLGGDINKEFISEITYFKKLYLMNEPFKYDLDLDSVDPELFQVQEFEGKRIKL
ncbi:hypothetical protein SteCoe_2821 [Stentor coeruleus]|uniref:ATP-dependent DNA helicase n=1 Tax=Stentor coeruleus TaxID=5963 RepID=A0A1R2CYI3_9CILI|nr:hypothetical protein SteCoe_2821 [Stentor coeruleus]